MLLRIYKEPAATAHAWRRTNGRPADQKAPCWPLTHYLLVRAVKPLHHRPQRSKRWCVGGSSGSL